MTPEHLFFREHGYLFLKAAVAKSQVLPVREHILGELKRLKIWSSGKMLSASVKQMPAFQQVTRLGQLLKYPGLQARIITPDMLSTLNALAGVKFSRAQEAQLLVSLPNQGEWSLHALNWHVDVSSTQPDRLPGIQLFVLIDDVKPRGGATLAIAGSHLLTRDEGRSQLVRDLLKGKGDIAAGLRGHNLSVLEMAGHAGDAWLMDMRLLHTPSVNSTKSVRMMATVRYIAA